MIKSVAVFCGSNAGARPAYQKAAQNLSAELAGRGLRTVYGGASIGLMGAVADAALAAGGEVIGVLPQSLAVREIAHDGLSSLHLVATMHERKALMADLSDAFIALPGGFGTLDETFEILTWSQLGLHQKPCGFLDVDDYYASLFHFIDHAAAEGFLGSVHRRLALRDDSPAGLLDAFDAWTSPRIAKWVTASDR